MSADLLTIETPALENEAPTATIEVNDRPLNINSRMLLAVMQAAKEHPSLVGALMLVIPMLVPTDSLMEYGHTQLYDSHVAELISRIICNEDLTLPTSAEIMVVCSAKPPSTKT